jgi:uncharacterized membrane protein YcjF (UPF0283 family)
MPLPETVVVRLSTWDSSATNYMLVGVGLIVFGVLASAAVVAFTDQLSKNRIKLLGFVAAACTALIAAFNPLSVGFAFRDAWRLLDTAVLRHSVDPKKYPVETVLDAVDKGEALISNASKSLVKSPEPPASAAKK